MSKPYLEVTFCMGKPFAAYLYINRKSNDVVTRSERRDDFVVDFTTDGRAIGVELIRLSQINLAALNAALTAANASELMTEDLAPLSAA